MPSLTLDNVSDEVAHRIYKVFERQNPVVIGRLNESQIVVKLKTSNGKYPFFKIIDDKDLDKYDENTVIEIKSRNPR